mmetsp:Transcript_12600/g.31874  ORF Transcript_12600/g.31874 Transcript_12600/m.31874 type:complete len:206 (-) Transcript_12600:346-963(-)
MQYTLPAWGSPCTRPVQNTISAKRSDSMQPTLYGSMPAARSLAASLVGTMSVTNSMVSTRLVVRSQYTLGTLAYFWCAKSLPVSSAFFPSIMKSSSAEMETSKSFTTQVRSKPPGLICCPNMRKTAKSDAICSSSPGYWIFTATSVPSLSTALWTCASEAAARGSSSTDWKTSLTGLPKSSSITFAMSEKGRKGALSQTILRASM